MRLLVGHVNKQYLTVRERDTLNANTEGSPMAEGATSRTVDKANRLLSS